MMEEGPLESPSQRWVVRTSPWEARMSLWIESPALIEVATSAAIFQFSDEHWSLDSAAWIGDDVVEWRVRKYPGNHLPVDLELQIDCARGVALFDDRELPLAMLERALNAKLHWIPAPT
jgi:hypothetical protein